MVAFAEPGPARGVRASSEVSAVLHLGLGRW